MRFLQAALIFCWRVMYVIGILGMLFSWAGTITYLYFVKGMA